MDKVFYNIKKRRTVRRFRSKKVSKFLIKKILEAGRWAPSAHNLQPWYFVVILKESIKQEIVSAITDHLPKNLSIGARAFLKNSYGIIDGSKAIVLVYNRSFFSLPAKRSKDEHENIAYVSEIQSISAAIQNMCLMAHDLGLGSAWLTAPLLVADRINKIVKNQSELIAIVCLGYSSDFSVAPKRKSLSSISEWIV